MTTFQTSRIKRRILSFYTPIFPVMKIQKLLRFSSTSTTIADRTFFSLENCTLISDKSIKNQIVHHYRVAWTASAKPPQTLPQESEVLPMGLSTQYHPKRKMAGRFYPVLVVSLNLPQCFLFRTSLKAQWRVLQQPLLVVWSALTGRYLAVLPPATDHILLLFLRSPRSAILWRASSQTAVLALGQTTPKRKDLPGGRLFVEVLWAQAAVVLAPDLALPTTLLPPDVLLPTSPVCRIEAEADPCRSRFDTDLLLSWNDEESPAPGSVLFPTRSDRTGETRVPTATVMVATTAVPPTPRVRSAKPGNTSAARKNHHLNTGGDLNTLHHRKNLLHHLEANIHCL